MQGIGRGARWSVLAVSVFAGLLLLTFGGALGTVSYKIADPETVKAWFADVDFYERGVDVIVTQVLVRLRQEVATRPDLAEDFFLLPREEVNAELQRVVPIAWLQEQFERVIDGVYAFMRRDTQAPQFTLDLSPIQENGPQVMATLLERRVQALPPCPPDVRITADAFDLFEAQCLPQNLPLALLNRQIQVEVAQLPLFEKSEISSEELGVGAPPGERVQTVYAGIAGTPLLLFSVALLLSALIIALAPTVRAKFYTLGSMWGMAGFLLLMIGSALYLLADSLFDWFIHSKLATSSDALRELAEDLFVVAARDISLAMIMLAGGMLLVGLLAILFSGWRLSKEASIEQPEPDTQLQLAHDKEYA